ncbi:MAG: Inosose isomerase, partial [uncultured Thermomicrobiales bacterium]
EDRRIYRPVRPAPFRGSAGLHCPGWCGGSGDRHWWRSRQRSLRSRRPRRQHRRPETVHGQDHEPGPRDQRPFLSWQPVAPQQGRGAGRRRVVPQDGSPRQPAWCLQRDHLLGVPWRFRERSFPELGHLSLADRLLRSAGLAVEGGGDPLLVGSRQIRGRQQRSRCDRAASGIPGISHGVVLAASRDRRRRDRRQLRSVAPVLAGHGPPCLRSGTQRCDLPRPHEGYVARSPEHQPERCARYEVVHRRGASLVDLPDGGVWTWSRVLALADLGAPHGRLRRCPLDRARRFADEHKRRLHQGCRVPEGVGDSRGAGRGVVGV